MRWCGFSAFVASLLTAGIASAANEIHVWYAYPDPNGADVSQGARTVKITLPGTYKIDVTNPLNPGGLGVIDKIWIDTGQQPLNDDVVVYVVRSGATPHLPGAWHVKSVNLTNVVSGKHGTVQELRCTGDVGSIDIITATDAGTIVVGGSVQRDIAITGDISEPVSIGGFMKANLSANSLGALTVSGIGSPPAIFPTISIGQTYGGAMTISQTLGELAIEGDIAYGANIQFTNGASLYRLNTTYAGSANYGRVEGTVSVAGELRQTHIGDLVDGATLAVGTRLGSNPANTSDYFHVHGAVAGILTVPTVAAAFNIDDGITETGSITVNQAFDTSAFEDPAQINGIEEHASFAGGSLASELDIGSALAGDWRIAEDLTGTLVLNAGSTGNVQIGTELSGTLNVLNAPLAGTTSIGNVPASGVIYADHGISAAVTIGTDMAGLITTNPPGESPGNGLSGCLMVSQDLSGTVDLAGDLNGSVIIGHDLSGVIQAVGLLFDPGDPNDPNAPLEGGHIIVNGSFKGPHIAGPYAIIKTGGGLPAGRRPFAAINASGAAEDAEWDPNKAYVQFYEDNDPGNMFRVYQNDPNLHLWAVRACRGDMDGDRERSPADIDRFVEALTQPQLYANDLPGLGGTAAPWTEGGSRAWHGDADGNDTFDYRDLNAFLVNLPSQCPGATWPGRTVPDLSTGELALLLLANTQLDRWDELIGLVEQLKLDETYADYWSPVYDYLTTSPNVGPGTSLDFGSAATELTFTLSNTTETEYLYTVSVDWSRADPLWLTVTPPLGANGVLGKGLQTFKVTVQHLCELATDDYAALVNVNFTGADPRDVAVTMTKPLPSPRVVPWLRLREADPNDLADPNEVIAGLDQWRRVTDTACLQPATFLNNWQLGDLAQWFSDVRAAILQDTGHDMRLLVAFSTGGYLGKQPDYATGWYNLGYDAANFVEATQDPNEEWAFVIDDEASIVDGDPNVADYLSGTYTMDWDAFDTGMGYLKSQLAAKDHSQGITVYFYESVTTTFDENCGWSSCPLDPNAVTPCSDPNCAEFCVFCRSVKLIEHVRDQLSDTDPSHPITVRFVSWGYSDADMWYDDGHLRARLWEDAHLSTPTFPEVLFGHFSANNHDYWPYNGLDDPNGTHVMDILNPASPDPNQGLIPRPDAFFYPPGSDWPDFCVDVVKPADDDGGDLCNTWRWAPPQP